MSEVPSPCISLCSIDPQDGFCRGCLRTLVEIQAWPHVEDPQRRAICARVERRRRARTAGAPPRAHRDETSA